MKLTDIVDRINGNVDRFNTDLEYYIGGEHFESNELEVTNRGILKENLGKLGFKFHFAFQDRDVLFMARNPHLRKAGMVRFSGLCSDASYILRSKDESKIIQEYLAVMLQSDRFWDYCESHKVGSVNFANNWSSIANYEFDLPSIEKQKEISNKVWAAYRLKEAYKKLLAATDEMVKSQFIEMFGDSIHAKKLIEVCNIEKGTTITKEQTFDGDVPVVAGGLEPSCYHNVANRPSGMITVSASGANAGYVNYWEVPIFASDCNTIYPIKPEEVNQIFMYWQLKVMQKQIFKLQKGGAQPHVYGKDLAGMQIVQPPMESQLQYVAIANQAEKSKSELKQCIENIDKVIKSLINN